MIFWLLALFLLFPILRIVFGLGGWLLGLLGTLIVGAIVLVAFAAFFWVFIAAALVFGGLWISRSLLS